MSDTPFVSLDTSGIITDYHQKAVYVLGSYIATKHSQSNTFLNRLTSLPKTLQEAGGNMRTLEALVTNDLDHLFGSYFNDVSVEVKTEPMKDNRGFEVDSRHNLIMAVRYSTPNGLQELSRSLVIEGTRLGELVTLEMLQ